MISKIEFEKRSVGDCFVGMSYERFRKTYPNPIVQKQSNYLIVRKLPLRLWFSRQTLELEQIGVEHGSFVLLGSTMAIGDPVHLFEANVGQVNAVDEYTIALENNPSITLHTEPALDPGNPKINKDASIVGIYMQE